MTTTTTRTASPSDMLAKERDALSQEIARLEKELADGAANRDRWIARATMDPTKDNKAARDQSMGAVVRLEAALAATRSALERVKQDIVDARETELRRLSDERLRKAAAAIAKTRELAEQADQAAAQLDQRFAALMEQVRNAVGIMPATYRSDVILDGHGLSHASLRDAVFIQLSRSGLTQRPLADPTAHRASMAALVAYACQGLLADAQNLPDPNQNDWEA